MESRRVFVWLESMDVEELEDIEADYNYAARMKYVNVSEEEKVHDVFKDKEVTVHDKA